MTSKKDLTEKLIKKRDLQILLKKEGVEIDHLAERLHEEISKKGFTLNFIMNDLKLQERGYSHSDQEGRLTTKVKCYEEGVHEFTKEPILGDAMIEHNFKNDTIKKYMIPSLGRLLWTICDVYSGEIIREDLDSKINYKINFSIKKD